MDRVTDPRLKKIREYWIKSNITQQQAACQMDMTQPSVSQYLNGHIPMNTDTVLKFARLLNRPPTDIDPDLKF